MNRLNLLSQYIYNRVTSPFNLLTMRDITRLYNRIFHRYYNCKLLDASSFFDPPKKESQKSGGTSA